MPASRISRLADGLQGSTILRIAGDVRAMQAEGRSVCNLTIGDFSPAQFPIPEGLARRIAHALEAGETNYPPSTGMPELRRAIASLYRARLALDCPIESVIVTGGARPAIYAAYRAIVDPGERVVYGTPSWNNAHYCQLAGAEPVPVHGTAETGFFPAPNALAPALRGARLLVLNTPLNPAGTCLDAGTLGAICDLVLAENERRGPAGRALYVLFDQVYWMLRHGPERHATPVEVRPWMAPYTILIDALSKSFAATGLRVGWLVAPPALAAPMGDLLGHVGAWAPRAEQVAAAELLGATEEIAAYHARMLQGVRRRLAVLHDHLVRLRSRGAPVEVVPPSGGIYLSARFVLHGLRAPDGTRIVTNEAIRALLLREAGVAVVPFEAFGASDETGWMRLSVGAVSMQELGDAMARLTRLMERFISGRP